MTLSALYRFISISSLTIVEYDKFFSKAVIMSEHAGMVMFFVFFYSFSHFRPMHVRLDQYHYKKP
jgi:hypothetical protein